MNRTVNIDYSPLDEQTARADEMRSAPAKPKLFQKKAFVRGSNGQPASRLTDRPVGWSLVRSLSSVCLSPLLAGKLAFSEAFSQPAKQASRQAGVKAERLPKIQTSRPLLATLCRMTLTRLHSWRYTKNPIVTQSSKETSQFQAAICFTPVGLALDRSFTR